MRLRFPDGFFWGSSTSAAQTETAFDHQWKGFIARDGFTLERTTDHEKRRGEDVNYICQFGSIYRCGIDWSRLQRAPFAQFDSRVVDEYQEFFQDLLEKDMKILLVLHHFANPNWFEAKGGWLEEDNIAFFVDFACKCMQHFGPYIFNWNTFNEPNVYAANAYITGAFPPHKRAYFKGNSVLKHMNLAHNIIYKTFKSKAPDHLIGISQNLAFFKGIHILGHLPAYLLNWWFNKRPARLFQNVDYLGFSYYAYVPFDPFPVTEVERPGRLDKLGIPRDEMWGYNPEGFGKIIRRMYKKYKKPIWIMESGICTNDSKRRIESIKEYLKVFYDAIQDGIDIRAYIHWSTWDNFEWNLGPSYRFGLVEVDLISKDRTMTEAGRFYHQVTQENEVLI